MLCPRCFAVKADEVLGERHWRLLEATNPLSALEQSDQDLERARVQDVTVYAMCRAGATANRIIQRLVQEKQALERSIVDYATQTGIHVPMRQMEVRLHREGEDLTGRLLCPGCEHSFPDPEGTALDKASAVRCMNCGRPVRRCE